MNGDKGRMDKLFPLQGGSGNVPILNQPPQMLVFAVQIGVTPQLREKLTKWTEKIGLPITELVGEIARQGLMELSRKIDDPKDRINHPETFFPRPETKE